MTVGLDERKNFILSTAGNYFQQSSPSHQDEGLWKNVFLNDFLEDAGCFILTVQSKADSSLYLGNKLPPGEGKEIVLVFFKIRPEAVTEENMRQTVFVVSMPDSPVVALYYTVQRIFAPTLLKARRQLEPVCGPQATVDVDGVGGKSALCGAADTRPVHLSFSKPSCSNKPYALQCDGKPHVLAIVARPSPSSVPVIVYVYDIEE
ncbi:Cytoplasmic dynein 2 heavy chain 1 [Homalodisca vitripennis]|nr:Cytoplasmic dynein 2 heavy chain 1 [Homalodisca vitripennis]